ncbi:MAG: DMT family transporter [Cyanobacteria bacterium P01_A01_bin.135]
MRTIALELLFVLLWSSGFIGAKYGLPYAGTFTLLFIRYSLVTLLLGLWLRYRKQLRLRSWAVVGRSAIVGLLAHAVWLSAVLGTIDLGASLWIVALITALQPMATSVLSGPLLGEPVSRMQWAGMGVGFAGVVVVIAAKLGAETEASWIAYGLPFLSTISLTVATLYQRHLNRRADGLTLPVVPSLFVQAAASAIALYPLAAWEGLQVQWTGQFVFALLWLALVLSLGAYGLMLKLLEYRTATRVSSLMYLSPPVTLLLGFLVFGDRLTWQDGLGLLVTAIGVGLVYRGETNEVTRTSPLNSMMP